MGGHYDVTVSLNIYTMYLKFLRDSLIIIGKVRRCNADRGYRCTYFDYIWLSTFDSHRISAKISSLYIYFPMHYGCHRQTDRFFYYKPVDTH